MVDAAGLVIPRTRALEKRSKTNKKERRRSRDLWSTAPWWAMIARRKGRSSKLFARAAVVGDRVGQPSKCLSQPTLTQHIGSDNPVRAFPITDHGLRITSNNLYLWHAIDLDFFVPSNAHAVLPVTRPRLPPLSLPSSLEKDAEGMTAGALFCGCAQGSLRPSIVRS